MCRKVSQPKWFWLTHPKSADSVPMGQVTDRSALVFLKARSHKLDQSLTCGSTSSAQIFLANNSEGTKLTVDELHGSFDDAAQDRR